MRTRGILEDRAIAQEASKNPSGQALFGTHRFLYRSLHLEGDVCTASAYTRFTIKSRPLKARQEIPANTFIYTHNIYLYICIYSYTYPHTILLVAWSCGVREFACSAEPPYPKMSLDIQPAPSPSPRGRGHPDLGAYSAHGFPNPYGCVPLPLGFENP
jgi:hypothetical protein